MTKQERQKHAMDKQFNTAQTVLSEEGISYDPSNRAASRVSGR